MTGIIIGIGYLVFIPAVLIVLWEKHRKKLSQQFYSVIPQDAIKFEIKAWWGGFDMMKTQWVNLPTLGEVIFLYNKLDLYIEEDKLTIAAKGGQLTNWGYKYWLRPLVIYRKETRTYSTSQFDALFLKSEMIADDFIITFWNYAYEKEMKLHIKRHQKEIQEKLVELWVERASA